MSTPNKREPGFYRVQLVGHYNRQGWIVAEYHPEPNETFDWSVPGDDSGYGDHDFKIIGERVIMPDETIRNNSV